MQIKNLTSSSITRRIKYLEFNEIIHQVSLTMVYKRHFTKYILERNRVLIIRILLKRGKKRKNEINT